MTRRQALLAALAPLLAPLRKLLPWRSNIHRSYVTYDRLWEFDVKKNPLAWDRIEDARFTLEYDLLPWDLEGVFESKKDR